MLKSISIVVILIFSLQSTLAAPSKEDIANSAKEFDLANIAKMKNDNEQAYTHLKKAVKLDPNNSTFINSAAYVAMTLTQYNVAVDYLNMALKLDVEKFGDTHPNVAAVYNNIGSVYSKQGDHKKAVEYYNIAYGIISTSLGEKHPQTVNIKRIHDNEKEKLAE